MSMEPKTIGWAVVTVADGAITTRRLYNMTVTRDDVGLYDIVIGQGGADDDLCMTNIFPVTGDAGGAATARAPLINHTNASQKIVSFFDDAGALADPTAFIVEFKRYPPLPTP